MRVSSFSPNLEFSNFLSAMTFASSHVNVRHLARSERILNADNSLIRSNSETKRTTERGCELCYLA